LGDDASVHLGITKYEPPIPTHMAGQVANCFGYTVYYDFDRWEQVPDIFDPGETVVATEKLHGTCTAILFHPFLNHAEMFGSRGEIMVHSKGLGAQGLAFKNVPENQHNLYVRQLNALLEDGFEDRLRELSHTHNDAVICVMGETFGGNVQDLNYGLKAPIFRTFDISIGGDWLNPEEFVQTAIQLGVGYVPILYHGAFGVDAIEKVRDGKSTIGEQHVREGVVVRSLDTTPHPVHGRKICKMISPDYLLRKVKGGEATEYQ
jgi:RNA ligase (TIGR02306 family)